MEQMEQMIDRGLSHATPTIRDNKEKKKKINLKYMRDKDRELVKGIFKYYEVPGGVMEFSYKAYKEDQVEKFTLYDGELYSLPLGVAKHLNNNGWYPIYTTKMSENGRSSAVIGKKVRRFGFHSLEFADVEGLGGFAAPPIEIVTMDKI
jgi:hypothetical protein